LRSQTHARRTKTRLLAEQIGDEVDQDRILLSDRGEFAENSFELLAALLRKRESHKRSQIRPKHRCDKLAVSEGGASFAVNLEELGHGPGNLPGRSDAKSAM
jgi:hypothetical protein